jgi:hypothetical protein
MIFTWKESMQTGLEASSSSTACSFSMKVLSLVCLGFGGGGGPMGTTSALMCLMAGVVTFSAWVKEPTALRKKERRRRGGRRKRGRKGRKTWVFHMLLTFFFLEVHENTVEYIDLTRLHTLSSEVNRMLLRLPKSKKSNKNSFKDNIRKHG